MILRLSFTVALLSTIAAALPWEEMPQQQEAVGMQYPAWYVPRPLTNPSSQIHPSQLFAPGRTAYPPNFPGYPTFGTPLPVGKSGGSGASAASTIHTQSPTSTYRPRKTTTVSSSTLKTKKPRTISNIEKYLPLMAKKKAKASTTTEAPENTTPVVTIVDIRQTKSSTTKAPKKPTRRVQKFIKTTTTTTTTEEPSTEEETPETTVATTTKKTRKPKVGSKARGKQSRLTSTSSGTSSTSKTSTTTPSSPVEFSILDYLWVTAALREHGDVSLASMSNSELLAAIKDVVKKLKSSIDEAGLKEDVQSVSDHFKNTLKEFAAASPVKAQLGRLFERSQQDAILKDERKI